MSVKRPLFISVRVRDSKFLIVRSWLGHEHSINHALGKIYRYIPCIEKLFISKTYLCSVHCWVILGLVPFSVLQHRLPYRPLPVQCHMIAKFVEATLWNYMGRDCNHCQHWSVLIYSQGDYFNSKHGYVPRREAPRRGYLRWIGHGRISGRVYDIIRTAPTRGFFWTQYFVGWTTSTSNSTNSTSNSTTTSHCRDPIGDPNQSFKSHWKPLNFKGLNQILNFPELQMILISETF